MSEDDKSKLINHLKDLFEDIDTSNFDFDTKFKENDEWDSMSALGLIAILDDNFDVQITGDQINNLDTIADLVKFIESE